MQTLCLLADAAATATDLVGPKAAALASLVRAGFPVPPGLCVTAAALGNHLRATGLEAASRELAGLVRTGEEWRRSAALLRAELGRAAWPVRPEPDLRAAIERLVSSAGPLLAVRSSALVEDRAEASFAGQFATFLGVVGFGELTAAVRACWASYWSERVLAYAQARGVNLPPGGMAVLVQAVVGAEVAGTALSGDPAMGDPNTMVVNAAWGLGRAVAEGEVTPDRWLVDRRLGQVAERQPGHKPLAARLGPGGGEVWERVPPGLVDALSLDDAAVLELAGLVERVEVLFGAPQEVEWARADGQVWLLQARPLVPVGADGTVSGPGAVAADDPLVARLRAGRVIDGQPTSPGRSIGPARVLRTADDLERVQPGEILVATLLRPSASAVIGLAGGLVVEAGGSTSHAARLARERRIPAIMGAHGATRLIRDGALVLVDGSLGRAYVDEG